MYYTLTRSGESRRRYFEKRKRRMSLYPNPLLLLEVGREQPAEEERFLHHVEELGHDPDQAQAGLETLIKLGYVELS